MSTYVYIAFEGLRTSPISEEAWMSAVQRCDELIVDGARASGGRGRPVIRLKKDRRATVRLDRFGVACATDPSKELIAVMFKVAAFLNADVYSERFNKYTSPDDWLRREKFDRRAFDQQRAYKEKQQLFRVAVWCAVCAASALFGFLLGSLFLALRH